MKIRYPFSLIMIFLILAYQPIWAINFERGSDWKRDNDGYTKVDTVDTALNQLAKTFDKDREYKAKNHYFNSGLLCENPYDCDVSELEERISHHYSEHGQRYVNQAMGVLEDPEGYVDPDQLAYFDEHAYDNKVDSDIKEYVERRLELSFEPEHCGEQCQDKIIQQVIKSIDGQCLNKENKDECIKKLRDLDGLLSNFKFYCTENPESKSPAGDWTIYFRNETIELDSCGGAIFNIFWA